MPWVDGCEPPDPSTIEIKGILLASEGRPFAPKTIDYVAQMAKSAGAFVHILSILRVWGTSLGFPMPGLMPSKREWDECRSRLAGAIEIMERRGVQVRAHALATRKCRKRILAEAERLGCNVIVMAADPPRHWLISDFLWNQEPYRVRRRAKIPVYLVVDS